MEHLIHKIRALAFNGGQTEGDGRVFKEIIRITDEMLMAGKGRAYESPTLKGKIDAAVMKAIYDRFKHASLADQIYVLECVQEVWNAERAKGTE